MAEHKTRPQDHRADSASGQEGRGRQHPTGTGPAYKKPSKRGTVHGTEEGKGGRQRGPAEEAQ
jgi:hypothetical protein